MTRKWIFAVAVAALAIATASAQFWIRRVCRRLHRSRFNASPLEEHGTIAPTAASLFPTGPVDRIIVDKSERTLATVSRRQAVRDFRVALGRGGLAPKQRQGDGRVPEGRNRITFHNAASLYHLALRIGYPTEEQRVAARSAGNRSRSVTS